jgi:hypothetical protein
VPKIPHSALLALKVSIEKSDVIMMGVPLYVIFSLTSFSILSLFSACFNDTIPWVGSILAESV